MLPSGSPAASACAVEAPGRRPRDPRRRAAAAGGRRRRRAVARRRGPARPRPGCPAARRRVPRHPVAAADRAPGVDRRAAARHADHRRRAGVLRGELAELPLPREQPQRVVHPGGQTRVDLRPRRGSAAWRRYGARRSVEPGPEVSNRCSAWPVPPSGSDPDGGQQVARAAAGPRRRRPAAWPARRSPGAPAAGRWPSNPARASGRHGDEHGVRGLRVRAVVVERDAGQLASRRSRPSAASGRWSDPGSSSTHSSSSRPVTRAPGSLGACHTRCDRGRGPVVDREGAADPAVVGGRAHRVLGDAQRLRAAADAARRAVSASCSALAAGPHLALAAQPVGDVGVRDVGAPRR